VQEYAEEAVSRW
jgi:DNA-binding protein